MEAYLGHLELIGLLTIVYIGEIDTDLIGNRILEEINNYCPIWLGTEYILP